MGSSLTPGFNYVRLGENTLAGASDTLEVQNIPSGYHYLVVYVNIASAGSASSPAMVLNNDAGVNQYTTQFIKAAGAVVTSNISTSTTATMMSTIAAGHSGGIQIQLNQAPTTGWKAFTSTGGTQDFTYNTSGAYNSTAEISRIKLQATAGTFDAGSSMLVYGVR